MPEKPNQVAALNPTDQVTSRYINPKTDFAFKHFFGKESHKDLLIGFLNGIFKGRKIIVDLEYNQVTHQGISKEDRKNIFDLNCTGNKGERFIVEMQQAKRSFFKDRMIYYTSNLIYQQGISVNSDWNYELPEVYLVAIMDFSFDDTHPDQYEHDVRLMDVHTHAEFYKKLGYIFIEMPKFKKVETELVTNEDGWLFSLRYMNTLKEIPLSLRDKEEFIKLFNIAEVSNLDPDEMKAYQASLKIARDNYSHDETIKREKAFEIAAELKKNEVSFEIIAAATGLTLNEIDEL
ncbi:Rpn family recombination-promoting nuclease/putative transposase [Pedobacter heparinus]|uniref:Transposase (putative) YhgA-like domain-containing protein n=1 Tax=Pedobacter heparinus (strain ATCC 13125 / DSM 2366 / CIP 104194 / JCM 7457 / NBRC 12017 / NCIMB 9290 / NRRL B-14731 / HIM 762-3) TaxID=485917 RepID=C6XVH2_PEDHD|nr:Rpn family recombination-promoting nuclease/putative transposase [Pedobacter heparinus]ACU04038.1 conserved hypothetical protein [Pedobacter heparinus DSM 2366]